MKNVLVVMPFRQSHKDYIEKIGAGCTFTYSSIGEATEELVCSADIILGNADAKLVAKSEKLQWIQLNSAGADPYCNPGILKPGTLLTCASGAYGLSVSEGMLAMTMMLCRKMDLYMRNQVERKWNDEGIVTSIWNSTTLVLGLGDIGSEYASRMKALGSHVIGVRKNTAIKPDCVDEVRSLDELDELLPMADFVAMVLPSTPATRKIMNEERLKKMKKGSFLINAGRGDAVDCDALDRVLRSGEALGGAALDVTDPEPLPADHPLWDAPRCIIAPHISGKFNLPETFERIVRIAGGNLEAFLKGDIGHMRSLVDLKSGYRKI